METKSMKNIISIFSIIIIFSCNSQENNYFEVIQKDRYITQENSTQTNVYYGINFKGKNKLLVYPLSTLDYNEEEKLKMIKELLKFEGDNRKCNIPVSNYNSKLSQIHMGSNKDYSVQLEALFLINQIFFDEPFVYSPIPILINNKTNKEQVIEGEIIEKAYKEYEKWLYKVEGIGFESAFKKEIYPLKGSDISWMYGTN